MEKVNQFVAPAYTPDIRGSQFQKTPLHDAAHKNNTQAAKILLEQGAEIEARDVDNRTPIHYFLGNQKRDVVRILLEKDAEIKARDLDNKTPLDLARNVSRSTEGVTRVLTEHTSTFS